MYVKAEMQPDNRLKLSFMADDFTKIQFATAKEIAGYVKKNCTTPGFFDSPYVFEREEVK